MSDGSSAVCSSDLLRDVGLPVRVIFDKVPSNLRPQPTVSVTVDSDRAGARAASLRYLTPGLGWNADYVALYDEKARKIDVQGWVTLTNNSGTTYNNAETLLVAGSVSQSGNRAVRPMVYPPRPLTRQTIRNAGHTTGQPTN